MSNDVHLGDCLEVMAGMEPNSVDAIVTDPPYGLAFMNKTWDHAVPSKEYWIESLRVAKPGAMLLAFGGTRVFHRLMVAIEDAGWEIRDTLMWVYGSGFPKSANISKLIDKDLGAEREVVGTLPDRWAGKGQVLCRANQDEIDSVNITIPATPQAQHWDGYGTALKPSWEPIVCAMKPIDGTYANNAMTHGVAGINVDACRVPIEARNNREGSNGWKNSSGGANSAALNGEPDGRWPANFVHDGSDEVMALFPDTQSGGTVSGSEPSRTGVNTYGKYNRVSFQSHNDQGSAARFFYCAKASQADRDFGLGTSRATTNTNDGRQTDIDNAFQRGVTQRKNPHPTVKPTELMRWLVRMVSMPNGSTILDPFMGSGSTGVACLLEGQKFIGIERDEESYQVASERLAGTKSITDMEWKVTTDTPASYEDMPLFAGA